MQSFQSFCEAVSSWHQLVNESLKLEMATVVQSYKQAFVGQGQWETVWGHVSAPVQRKIQLMCGAL